MHVEIYPQCIGEFTMLFKRKSGLLRGYYSVASGFVCRLFIGLLAFHACVNYTLSDELDELKDAEYVFHSLKKTARELRSCRLVVAFRETKRDASNKIKLENVTFADMWIDNDAIQCKELRKDKAEPTIEWWDGFNWDSSPFSAEKLEEQVAYPSYLRLFVGSHSPNSATYTPSAPGLDVHIGV
jgi:hypothetical protein